MHQPRSHWTILVALVLSAAVAGAAPSKASALAKEADKLYKDGRYREAAETLKQAYDVDQNPLYLYNMARAWDQADEPTQALDYYRQYVALPSDTTQPDLVKKANLNMDRLRTRIAKAEADRKIQDAEKKRLEDDRKKAEERAEDEARAAREQRAAYEAKEKAEREAKQSTVGTKRLISYAVGGVGVASLAVSLTFAILAGNSKNTFLSAVTLADKTNAEATTRTQALVTDLALVVGLAAVATAIVLFPKGADAQPSVSVALVPLLGGGAASIGGVF